MKNALNLTLSMPLTLPVFYSVCPLHVTGVAASAEDHSDCGLVV